MGNGGHIEYTFWSSFFFHRGTRSVYFMNMRPLSFSLFLVHSLLLPFNALNPVLVRSGSLLVGFDLLGSNRYLWGAMGGILGWWVFCWMLLGSIRPYGATWAFSYPFSWLYLSASDSMYFRHFLRILFFKFLWVVFHFCVGFSIFIVDSGSSISYYPRCYFWLVPIFYPFVSSSYPFGGAFIFGSLFSGSHLCCYFRTVGHCAYLFGCSLDMMGFHFFFFFLLSILEKPLIFSIFSACWLIIRFITVCIFCIPCFRCSPVF